MTTLAPAPAGATGAPGQPDAPDLPGRTEVSARALRSVARIAAGRAAGVDPADVVVRIASEGSLLAVEVRTAVPGPGVLGRAEHVRRAVAADLTDLAGSGVGRCQVVVTGVPGTPVARVRPAGETTDRRPVEPVEPVEPVQPRDRAVRAAAGRVRRSGRRGAAGALALLLVLGGVVAAAVLALPAASRPAWLANLPGLSGPDDGRAAGDWLRALPGRGDATAALVTAAVVLALLGLWLLAAALLPGGRGRRVMEPVGSARVGVVVDDGVVGDAVADTARVAARTSPANVDVTVRRRRTLVRISPANGTAVPRDAVERAVSTRLDGWNVRGPGRRVAVRVRKEGVVGP